MPVVDVGLYRWWVWVCADLSGCFIFLKAPVVAVGVCAGGDRW